ncbi:unnamed protein product, partial [Adineta steineri]
MASILKLQVITGPYNEEPLAYLLQTDDFRFLLDCGWDENFSPEIIEEYKRHIESIDAILITYPDLYHLGALPYLVGHCGLKCPVYATVPVYKMGQMFMYDLHQSRSNSEDFTLFTLDHINAAFNLFVQLKYDCRPTLLITDASNTKYSQGQRKTNDTQLLTTILESIRRDGNVLICVDTAGRVLELALLLEQLWGNKQSGLFAYSLVLLNNCSSQVIEFASTQVEWMSDKIVQHQPDLESGFARDLFIQWVENDKNSIILTTKTCPGTLARELIDKPNLTTIEVEVRQKVPLEGTELEEYLEQRRIENGNEAAAAQAERMDIDLHTPSAVRLLSQSPFAPKCKVFAMFPYKEEKYVYNDYGEIINPNDYMIIETKSSIKNNNPPQPQPSTILFKTLREKRELKINAKVLYVDFEARSDRESIGKLLNQIKPKNLILIHSTQDCIEQLEKYCTTRQIVQGKIFAPCVGEIVDATTERNLYQIKLKDSLLSSIKFVKTRD